MNAPNLYSISSDVYGYVMSVSAHPHILQHAAAREDTYSHDPEKSLATIRETG
jgi:hypothetical protein